MLGSDTRGNSSNSQFTIEIEDTTKPILSLPANIIAEATGSSGAAVSYRASASDIVDGPIAPSCSPTSSSTFAIQTTAVNCSATDNTGNTATGGFNVTVQDTTPPALTLPSLSPVEASGPSGAVVNFSSTAADIVDGAVSVSCTPASGSVFTLGSTSASCSATDSHGNTASGSFNVAVADTTPPNLTVPADQLVEAIGPGGATVSYSGATANDSVSGAIAPTCTPASGSVFGIATTTVTCSATDAAGNTGIATFTVKVQDTLAPTVLCGSADGVWHNADVVIGCTSSDGGSGLANPADASFSLTTNVPAGTDTVSASTNSHAVSDVAGNSTTGGPITGNKVDKKAPSIVLTAPTATTYTLNQNVAASFGCTDTGSGVASCVGTAANGSNINTASIGAKTFTVNAADNVGNPATASVSYNVQYAAGGTCLGAVGHAILQPINTDGSSIFRLGSTVPAKFRVCDANGNSISSASLVTLFKLTAKSTEPANSTINEDVLSTTPDTTFRWDASAQQWIFNISTKSGYTVGTKYTYTISLNDGLAIVFSFGVK